MEKGGLETSLVGVFPLWAEVGIAVLSEGVGLTVEVGTHVDGALVFKSGRITAGHTEVGHQFQRVDPSLKNKGTHPWLIREDVRQPYFGIGLPTHLLAEGGVVVQAQS